MVCSLYKTNSLLTAHGNVVQLPQIHHIERHQSLAQNAGQKPACQQGRSCITGDLLVLVARHFGIHVGEVGDFSCHINTVQHLNELKID
jgi:hypothetical protein